MPHAFEILDSTLREGEQCFGVFFSIETKKRIAALLDEIGVDFIEAGHPAAAPSIEQAVSEIAGMRLRARVIAHARLDCREIRLVRDLGLQWVGLFAGISEQSLKRYGRQKHEVYKRVREAVLFARRLGLRVKFACEDASRTDARSLVGFYRYLQSLGVDRLSYADTLGLMTPEALARTREAFQEQMPFSSLHFHFHDDFGRAAENASYAARCGAKCIDASILGIGERTGLVPLECVMNGRAQHQIDALAKAVKLVGSCIDQDHYNNRRFAHKSGIHINGMIKDPASYEPTGAENAGRQRLFVLSKLIGRSGLQALLSRHGFHHVDVMDFLRRIKSEEMLELAGPEDICRYFRERGLERQTYADTPSKTGQLPTRKAGA